MHRHPARARPGPRLAPCRRAPTFVTVRAGVLDVEVMRSGDPRVARGPSARLPVRRAQLRQGLGASGRGRSRRRGALLRGLRRHPVRRCDDHAFRSAGGRRPRPCRADRRAQPRSTHRGRLRLGRSRGLRGRCAVARSGVGAGERQRLPAAGHREQPTPSPPHLERKHWYQYYLHGERGRAGLREHRADARPPAVGGVVSDLDVRRRRVRGDPAGLRQPRLRRRRGALVPAPVRPRRRRPGVRRHRAQDRRAAIHHRADNRARRRARHGDASTPRDEHEPHFTSLVDYRLVDAGHALPQEAPEEFARAVLDVRQ